VSGWELIEKLVIVLARDTASFVGLPDGVLPLEGSARQPMRTAAAAPGNVADAVSRIHVPPGDGRPSLELEVRALGGGRADLELSVGDIEAPATLLLRTREGEGGAIAALQSVSPGEAVQLRDLPRGSYWLEIRSAGPSATLRLALDVSARVD
jgi:hypothetical protein